MIDLYLLNLLAWFFPLAFTKGAQKIYLAIIVVIISSSYWIYLPVSDMIGQPYSAAIIEIHLIESLKYSAIAGIAFNLAFLLMSKKSKVAQENQIIETKISIINYLPGAPLRFPLKILAFSLIALAYSNSVPYAGHYSRIEWLDSSAGNTHAILTSLASVVVFYTCLLDNKKNNRASALTLTIVLLHIFIVGFDGSRRASFTAILGYLIIFLSNFISAETDSRRNKRELFIFIALALLINYLSINRSFHVGWSILAGYEKIPDYALKAFISSIFSPMPTLHVNTHMIEYIRVFGDQGYWNYISALLNTIFPRFIFGEYLFGDPLVVQLHEKLGWYGFDFGFLAEAIYSGGLIGVITMHFLLGSMASIILRGAAKGGAFYFALSLGFIFALLNGLRSDFMNFSKAFLYLSVFLYILGKIPLLIKRRT